MHTAVLWAAAGTGFTFLMTTLGAGLVFFFRKQFSAGLQRVFLGFAAGVMIAAAVWSLLIPAIDQAEAAGLLGWVPAAGGFLLGVGFLIAMDQGVGNQHSLVFYSERSGRRQMSKEIGYTKGKSDFTYMVEHR